MGTGPLRGATKPVLEVLAFSNLRHSKTTMTEASSSDLGADSGVVEAQLAVLRGQMFNLAGALRDGLSPAQLARLPPQLMVELRHRSS